MKKFRQFIFENTIQSARDVLGLAGSFTEEELKLAYRRASAQHHPDKGGSTEMMKKVNTAYELLKKEVGVVRKDSPEPQYSGYSRTTRHRSDWSDTEWEAFSVQTRADLREKYKPQLFVDYFEKTFNEKFTYVVTSPNQNDLNRVNILTEFKNHNGTIAFDLQILVSVMDVAHASLSRGLGVSGSDISYEYTLIAYGYANAKKQKMAQRDFSFKVDHSVMVKPETIYPLAKLKKMLPSEKSVNTDKPMTKASFKLGLTKECKLLEHGHHDPIIFVELTDGLYVQLDRDVFMKKGMWRTRGIIEKRVTGIITHYSVVHKLPTYLFFETYDDLMNIKKLNNMNTGAATRYIETLVAEKKVQT